MTASTPDIQELIEEVKAEADAQRDLHRLRSAGLMERLAAALSALSGETEIAMTGQIVTASIETGKGFDCGLEDCECPDHESVPPAGTYITVRLDDENLPVGLWRVAVNREVTK